MKHIYNDGGRAAAGYTGKTGDCVTRAIAIATSLPYGEVYDTLFKRGGKTPRNGVSKDVYRPYLAALGWQWVPCMRIGSGCKVHLTDGELPSGRIICRLSKHLCAVIDGAIHDTFDPRREAHCVTPYRGQALRPGEWLNSNGVCSIQRRCVYGYWHRLT